MSRTGKPRNEPPLPSDSFGPARADMAKILVTDGEQRATLATVRSLGLAGHDVWITGAMDRPLTEASRHCRGMVRVRDPVTTPEGFLADLSAWVVDHRPDIIIPMTDTTAPLVLDARDRWPEVRVPFPSRAAYERISDKRHLAEVARGLGVPVPEQTVIADSEAGFADAVGWAAQYDFGVVLKPARSAVWTSSGVTKFGVHLVLSERDMEGRLSSWPREAYPVLLQRRVSGHGAGVFMLAEEGRTVAAFAHRRLREKPPTGGVSVYRESVPLGDDIRAHAEAVLRAFDWSGVAMVEFKVESGTGIPYLMEVNARFWGSLQLAIDAGVDFPRLLAASALGGRPSTVPKYEVGVRSRWFWGDVDHLLWLLRASNETRRAHPGLPGRIRSIAAVANVFRRGDRFEVARLDDPRPFFRESWQWVEALFRR